MKEGKTKIIGWDFIDIPGYPVAIDVPMDWDPSYPPRDRRTGPVIIDSTRLLGGTLEIRHDGIRFDGIILPPGVRP